MKKIFMMIVLCFGVFSLAQAQTNTNQTPVKTGSNKNATVSEKSIDPQVQNLKTKLALSDAQTSQVSAIYKKYGEKQKALRNEAKKAGKTVDPKQLSAMRTQRNKEVEALLSADQKTKFENSLKAKSSAKVAAKTTAASATPTKR